MSCEIEASPAAPPSVSSESNMPEGRENDSHLAKFTAADELALHQLRLRRWLAEQSGQATRLPPRPVPEIPRLTDLSAPWKLTPDLELMDWQIRCREAWFAHGCRGTVKVVTGAGKTVLALAAAEKLQNERCPELHVAVVVPTIVLMNQWYERLTERTNLPPDAVGRLGGGFQDSFEGGRRVLVAVLDTAHKELPGMVERLGLGDKLLLIVDECHRAGAPLMRRVLSTPRAFSLGLSATPERDDWDEDAGPVSFDESVLGKELGGLIYELSLAEALEMGIIPPYTIKHYGLELTPSERWEYERLSRVISEARQDLENRAPAKAIRGSGFFAWVQRTSQRHGTELSALAARFLSATAERKELLYMAEARFKAVARLLREEFAANPEAMAILFHESIEAVNRLFLRLREQDLPVVLEHSQLPRELRENSLDLFRRGVARVVVSARSLIEGFDVPAVDVGIVVASSTSVRQRIQTMGRALRKHKTARGEEKSPVIHILYIRDTVDEVIYEREDWARLTGAERNLYYRWDPEGEPEPQPGPPRASRPSDEEVDVSDLRPGDLYAGRLEGTVFSCDSQGNIRDERGRYLAQPTALYRAVCSVLGRPGRFYVTPRKFHCIVNVPTGDEWEVRYVTTLPHAPIFSEGEHVSPPAKDPVQWVQTANVGDLYPFPLKSPVEKLKFSQKRGGVIAKKVRGGEVFARVGDQAVDPVKGEDARRLLDALKTLQARGEPVTHFEVDAGLFAVYRREGQLRFLVRLEKGLEFPDA